MKKNPNSITQLNNFHPTPNMEAVLRSALDPETKANVTGWCKAAGVSRELWYEWQKSPKYREWWDREWKRRFKWKMDELDKIGMKKAETDFRYFEFMQKKYAELNEKFGGDKHNTFVLNIPRPNERRVIDGNVD